MNYIYTALKLFKNVKNGILSSCKRVLVKQRFSKGSGISTITSGMERKIGSLGTNLLLAY